MQIDWWTLILQAVNFLILVWLLARFLYRPARAVIDKRRQLAERAFEDAAHREQQAEAARLDLERQRTDLEREHQALRDKVHEELDAERREIIEAARREADELRERARAAVAGERDAALAEIRGRIADLAADLAADLLRGIQPPPSNALFLERLMSRLDTLPALERERLEHDLTGSAACLTVATATPLTEAERGQWSERLSAGLGRPVTPEFVTDPALVGGAELRFPHAVLRLTWEEQLRKARELLEGDDHPT